MYESWHIRQELIDAIAETNCKEADRLIFVTKVKESVISILSVIIFVGIPCLIVSIIGIIASNIDKTRNECWIVLLVSLPAVVVSVIVSETLKKSILENINSFVRKKKIKWPRTK